MLKEPVSTVSLQSSVPNSAMIIIYGKLFTVSILKQVRQNDHVHRLQEAQMEAGTNEFRLAETWENHLNSTTDRQQNCWNLHLNTTEHDAIASRCNWNTGTKPHNGHKDLQDATKTNLLSTK